MAKTLTTNFNGFRERNCTMSIVLDIRSNRTDITEYPVCARFTIDRKRYYYRIGGSYSKKEFSEICNVQKSKSPKYEVKQTWLAVIEQYKLLLEHCKPGKQLLMEDVRMQVEGIVPVDGKGVELSFVTIWESVIHRLKTENNKKQFSTGESYDSGLRSFKKILWNREIKGFQNISELIMEWDAGMQHGVKDADGKLVGKISDSTRGIYLRGCLVAWNQCKSMGYLSNQEFPISVKGGGKGIPKGSSRKHEFINREDMTRLYEVFINKEYPESWGKTKRENVHHALGMLLVQYLCNGFNMADAGQLKYTKYYFNNERKAFKFHRQKTAGRSKDGAEVIIPITPPLQRILDELAAPPKLDAYVFPEIHKGETDPEEIRRRNRQENKNVDNRMKLVCKDVLGWEKTVSSTWARHSFASNLAHLGVEERYISESMGHSCQQSVTDLYIAHYPLEKQMEINSMLLDLDHKPRLTASDIMSMSEEEKTALLLEMLNRK